MHTILIADDSVTIQRAVEIVFDKEPFRVVKAGTGAETLQRAKDSAPALVLMDHLIGDRTGYEVAEALRADPSTAQIPILMLSGSSAPYDEARARAAGVLGHLPKPFDCTTLLDRVKTLLGVTASGPVAGASTAPTPAAVAATPRAPAGPAGFAGLARPPTTQPIASAPLAAASAATTPIARAPTRDLDPFGFGASASQPPAAAARPAIAATTTTSAQPMAQPTAQPTAAPSQPITAQPAISANPPLVHVDSWRTSRTVDAAFDGPAKPASKPIVVNESAFMEVSDLDVAEAAPIAVAPVAAAAPKVAPIASAAVTAGFVQAVATAATQAGVPSQAALSQEARAIIERVAWEVVPELAEIIIREELKRLLAK